MNPSPSHAPSTPNLRRIQGILFLTLFLDLVGFAIIFPLYPDMLHYYLNDAPGQSALLAKVVRYLEKFSLAFSGNSWQAQFSVTVLFGGLLGSLFSVMQFVAAPLWGRFSDRWGRRRILQITVAGTALSYGIWFFADSFGAFVGARLLAGIMAGNIGVVSAAMADVTGREKRSGGMAILGIAFGLGLTLGPAIGGLCSKVDLRGVFPFLTKHGMHPFSLAAFVALTLSSFNMAQLIQSFPETLPLPARLRQKEKRPLLPQIVGIFRSEVPAIRQVNLLHFLYQLAFTGMEFTLVFLTTERLNWGPAANGMLFVLIGVVLMGIQGGLARRLVGRGLEKKLIMIGMACGMGGLCFLGIAQGPMALGLVLAGAALMACSIGFISPCIQGLVSLYASDDTQGHNLSLLRSAGSMARALGPIVSAMLYFYFGSKVSYTLGAAFIGLPLLLATRLPATPVTRRCTA